MNVVFENQLRILIKTATPGFQFSHCSVLLFSLFCSMNLFSEGYANKIETLYSLTHHKPWEGIRGTNTHTRAHTLTLFLLIILSSYFKCIQPFAALAALFVCQG